MCQLMHIGRNLAINAKNKTPDPSLTRTLMSLCYWSRCSPQRTTMRVVKVQHVNPVLRRDGAKTVFNRNIFPKIITCIMRGASAWPNIIMHVPPLSQKCNAQTNTTMHGICTGTFEIIHLSCSEAALHVVLYTARGFHIEIDVQAPFGKDFI